MRSPIYAMLNCADLSNIVGVPAGSVSFRIDENRIDECRLGVQ